MIEPKGGGDDPADKFIGTWTYNANSTTALDCQNNALDTTITETGTFQIAAGTSSDLIDVPDADDTCPPTRYDVNGNVATIQSGQTCMETKMTNGGATYMINAALNTGTYTLSGDGMMVNGTSTAGLTFTGAIATTCTATLSMSATKTGN